MGDMDDEKTDDAEIILTPAQRAVVAGAIETAEGICALSYGDASGAVEHFAAAARWQAVSEMTKQGT